MDRLLTDEIECFVRCSHCGKKVSNTVKSTIPEGLVVRAFVECVDCVTNQSAEVDERTKTLKAVGEWLDEYCDKERKQGVVAIVPPGLIDQLKQGRMPETALRSSVVDEERDKDGV